MVQPYFGVKEEGVMGLGKGIGKGLGGLVFKTSAAAFAIPGYTLKGMEKQFEKRYTRGLKAAILAVRLKQGLRALLSATEEEKNGVLRRWKLIGEKVVKV